ncbi:MAG: hypothetical protein U0641_11810 [Anaerolineae bacterium]
MISTASLRLAFFTTLLKEAWAKRSPAARNRLPTRVITATYGLRRFVFVPISGRAICATVALMLPTWEEVGRLRLALVILVDDVQELHVGLEEYRLAEVEHPLDVERWAARAELVMTI